MKNNKIVLCVDDEIQILNSLKRIFRKLPISLITTQFPEKGLEIAKNENIDIAIIDYRMPMINGVDLVSQIKDIKPKITCIILSGYADESTISTAMSNGLIYKYLLKPWSDEELVNEVKRLIE
jgi:YesN/AraC family two-component response regulator